MKGICIFVMVLFAPAFAVHVPPPPPAGIVERQIEQEYDAQEVDPEKQAPVIDIDIPEKELDLGHETVFLKHIVFSGNESVSRADLSSLAKEYEGREVTMQEIQQLCRKIQSLYAHRGYILTRAYSPEQEIKDGELAIKIVEGRLGEISVIGNKYYSDQFIRSYFQPYKKRPIQYKQFLKAVLLLDENMDLNSGVIFKKGKEFGTVDAIIRVQDQRPVHLTIDHNNYGSLNTSKQRTGVRLDWGSLLLYGDKLTLIEVVGSPMSSLDFTDAVYRFPLNRQGAAFEMSYLFANFKTVKNSDDVRFTGRSHIATAKFVQAIYRTRTVSADLFTSFDYKQIQNFGNGAESSNDKLRVFSGGLHFDGIDTWQGRNLLNLFVGWGIPKILGGSSINDKGGSRQDAGGRFLRLNGAYERVQQCLFDTFCVFNSVGQYSFDKLPLPEQIYIGGIDTVRGYKLAEGLGDSGFYMNLELRVPPPFLRNHKVPWMKKTWGEFLQFVGFLDHGQTFTIGANRIEEIEKTSSGHRKRTAVAQPGRVVLTSAGAGLRIYGPWQFEISLDAGYPLTERFRSSTTIIYLRIALKAL